MGIKKGSYLNFRGPSGNGEHSFWPGFIMSRVRYAQCQNGQCLEWARVHNVQGLHGPNAANWLQIGYIQRGQGS